MYDNVHDAEMRLSGTVIRFLNEPVYVRSVYTNNNNIYLHLQNCINDEEKKVKLTNEGIDISSPPLGFIQSLSGYGMTYFYAARMPARKQQQGLDTRRMVVYNPIAGGIARLHANLRQIGECIKGLYTDNLINYRDLIKTMDPRIVIAFSRNIAASTSTLYYKTHPVGKIEHRDGKHIVTLTSTSFVFYNFEGVLNVDWRIVRP